MKSSEIYDMIVDYTGVEDNPLWMQYPPAMKFNAIVHRLTGAIEHCWTVLSSASSQDDEELIIALEDFFDKYIQPIDFEDVPDMVGAFLKSQLRGFIRYFVAAIAAEVKGSNA